MAIAPPILPYENVGSDTGVVVLKYPDLLRVIVPPVRRIQDLGKSYFGWCGVALYFLLATVVPALSSPGGGPLAQINGTLYSAILVLAILIGVDRLRRRIVFDITSNTFAMTYIGITGRKRTAWRLADVLDAHINPYTSKLHLRIRGQDALEIFLGSAAKENQRVAAELAAALASPPIQLFDANPAARPAYAVRRQAGMTTVQRTCAIVCVALSVCAFAVMIFFSGVAGFYLLLLAGVPAGLAFGTQDKEFYV